MNFLRLFCNVVAAAAFACSIPAPASARFEAVDCWFRADEVFPEYAELWSNVAAKEAAELGPHAGPQKPAGSVHFYVRNRGGSAAGVKDVLVDGISLKQAIAFRKGTGRDVPDAAGYCFSDLNEEQRSAFRRAGAPIWWKCDPESIPPGGFAEITIRLRYLPESGSAGLKVDFSDGTSLEQAVRTSDSRPRIEDICFSPGLDRAYLYVRRPAGCADAPARVIIDGMDVTGRCDISHDPAVGLNVVAARLERPTTRAAFHVFQVAYPACGSATAAVRAWDDEPAYGIWGARPARADETGVAESYVREIAAHNINVQMEMIGSEGVADLLKSDEGQRLMKSLGIRRMISEPGKGRTRNPYAYFLQDEPDARDFYVKDAPAGERLGTTIPVLVAELNEYRRVDPVTPNLVNVDMTFKPDNYRVYGQLTDIFCTDPYYLPRIFQSFTESPSCVSLYTKAAFLLASALEAKAACAPKPLHMILFSTRGGRVKRFSTPQEKRIEFFYSLGAGAKGISYWWYTPGDKAEGCGSDDPDAKMLWREIGLLGAEFGTLSPLIAVSSPADLPLRLAPNLWGKVLLAGNDTLMLILVNDDYACDRLGTSIKPVDNAFAEAVLPGWLEPKDVFEITAAGTGGVSWGKNGSAVKMELGTLEINRVLIVTSDTALRGKLQKLYDSRYAGKVKRLLAE